MGREPSERAIAMLAKDDPRQLQAAEKPCRRLRSLNNVAWEIEFVTSGLV
jgi:hypothetical protein